MKKIICLLLCLLCVIPVACKPTETNVDSTYIIMRDGYMDDECEWRYTVDDSSIVSVDVEYAAQNSETSEPQFEENLGIAYEEKDGKYVLESGKEYKYKLFLEGKLPNAAYGAKFTVLSNNESLTFDDVAKSLNGEADENIINNSIIIGVGVISEKEANEKYGYKVYYLYKMEQNGVVADLSQMILMDLDYKSIEMVLRDDNTGTLSITDGTDYAQYDLKWDDLGITYMGVTIPCEKEGELITLDMGEQKFVLAPSELIEKDVVEINNTLAIENKKVPKEPVSYQFKFDGKKVGKTTVKFEYHSIVDNSLSRIEVYEVNVTESDDGKLTTSVVMTAIS